MIGLIDNTSNKNSYSIFNSFKTINYKITSLVCQILSVPRLIVRTIRRAVYHLVDPNWRFFVQESRGHFTSPQEREHFFQTLKKVDDIINTKIINHPETPTGWKAAWAQFHQTLVDPDKSWKIFQEKHGTCLGNCTALTEKITSKGEVLEIKELHAIEAGIDFSKEAISFQLLQQIIVQTNELIDSKFDSIMNSLEEKAQLNDEELKVLGPERTKEIKFERHVECLKTYDLSIADLAKLQDEEFSNLMYLIKYHISFEKAQQAFQIKNVQNIQMFLAEFAKLSPLTIGFRLANLDKEIRPKTDQFLPSGYGLIKKFPHIISPNETWVQDDFSSTPYSLKNEFLKKYSSISSFSGVFLIGGKNKKNLVGHSMFMEMDQDKKIYILYDNNRGFYQFNDFHECLDNLTLRCQDEKFDQVEILPILFPKN